MSAKLDRSLDDIVKVDRRSGRVGRGGRAASRGRNNNRTVVKTTKTAGPIGGISKKVIVTKTGKGAKAGKANNPTFTKPKNPKTPPPARGSKIVVSNLPPDISEKMIKEYFDRTCGPLQKAELTYGPNGASRGVATVYFRTVDGAANAAKLMNGVQVDGIPMKVEIVVDAALAPAPKTLSERMTFSQPKPATAPAKNGAKAAGKKSKAAGNAATPGQTAGRGKGRKGRNTGRGKPKTAEELDAEMTDYFGTGEATGGQAGATNGAEVGMTDDIM